MSMRIAVASGLLLAAPAAMAQGKLEDVAAETKAIQQSVNNSKSTLEQLQASIAERTGATSRVELAYAAEIEGYTIESVQYVVDGVVLPTPRVAAEVTERPLRPGPHALTVKMELRGDGSSAAYMKSYAFKLQASTELDLHGSVVQKVRAVVVPNQGSGRPMIRFDSSEEALPE
ncbi:MAG: hypothetical protein H6737_21290 [Alphaproteobacteria bacterium]|nr:hypothetical protein [Alphaproteobacteria bacterium]